MSSNGYLTTAELSPAAGGIPGPNPGQGQLAHSAAAAWNAMNSYAVEHLGVHLTCDGPDSMYRPYADQVALRNSWCARGACSNAAVPGTSNHGWGTAVDLPPYVQAICDSSATEQFGWNKRYSDAPWEAWHRHYGGTYHGKDPGTGGGQGPTPNRYPLLHKGMKGGAVKRAQKHLHRWNVGITRPKPDGSFGKTTEKAVREFQVTHDLHPDGKIGPKTWKKLRQVDPYLADERGHLNKLRLLRNRGGAHSKRAREDRAWLLKRAASIKKVAAEYGWKGQHRRSRYKTLRRAAGGK